MTRTYTIGVIGGGAFGTALAIAYAKAGHSVLLWVRRAEQAQRIAQSHVNTDYLPDVLLPDTIIITTDLADMSACPVWLLVTPAQATREVVTALRHAVSNTVRPRVLCSKGIEIGTQSLLHEIVADIWPACPVALLSGPSFASDIAHQNPCAMTLACDTALSKTLIDTLSLPSLRLYHNPDMIGAAIGGAVKNVLAIACGIVSGLQLGDSTRAALITRGLSEISRLALAMGGQRDTLFGLCGLGDLVLTCTSTQSRNFSFGQRLGAGEKPHDILKERLSITEGVHTAQAVAALADRLMIDMPITLAVRDILAGQITAAQAMHSLLSRPSKAREDI